MALWGCCMTPSVCISKARREVPSFVTVSVSCPKRGYRVPLIVGCRPPQLILLMLQYVESHFPPAAKNVGCAPVLEDCELTRQPPCGSRDRRATTMPVADRQSAVSGTGVAESG